MRGSGVVRFVRSKNGIVQRRHVRHLKRFKEKHRKLGRAWESVELQIHKGAEVEVEKTMLNAFMDWGSDRKQIQRKIVEQFDKAPLNKETDGTYQKRLGEKYGNTKIRYNPKDGKVQITLRGYEYEQAIG